MSICQKLIDMSKVCSITVILSLGSHFSKFTDYLPSTCVVYVVHSNSSHKCFYLFG